MGCLPGRHGDQVGRVAEQLSSEQQALIVVVHEVRFGSPKTAKGSRVIELDPATVAVLREHRRVQAAERLLVGSGWRDHGLVFCRVDGRVASGSVLSVVR